MRVTIQVDDGAKFVHDFDSEDGDFGFRWHPGLKMFALWEWRDPWPPHQYGTIGEVDLDEEAKS